MDKTNFNITSEKPTTYTSAIYWLVGWKTQVELNQKLLSQHKLKDKKTDLATIYYHPKENSLFCARNHLLISLIYFCIPPILFYDSIHTKAMHQGSTEGKKNHPPVFFTISPRTSPLGIFVKIVVN